MNKKCTKCGEVKELEGFSKRSRNKDGYRGTCRLCATAMSKAWQAANRERQAAHSKAWRIKNKEHIKEYARDNKEHKLAMSKAWKVNNSDRLNFYTAKRRAAKLLRTVSWANMKAIKDIYAEARRLEKATGIAMHVDHILPLQGKMVSGLHVETNLQLLTWCENISKSNNFKP